MLCLSSAIVSSRAHTLLPCLQRSNPRLEQLFRFTNDLERLCWLVHPIPSHPIPSHPNPRGPASRKELKYYKRKEKSEKRNGLEWNGITAQLCL